MSEKPSACESADSNATLLARLADIENKLGWIINHLEVKRGEKDWYTTAEVAELLGKRPYTVREWCRLRRINAEKSQSGRGIDEEWRVSQEEICRIRNEGLLPRTSHYK